MARELSQTQRAARSRTAALVLVTFALACGCCLGAQTPASVAALLANAATLTPPLNKTTGQMLGVVTDAAGRPEAGAVVQVRSDSWLRAPWNRLTSSAGVFTISDLTPGVYYVEVGKGLRVASRRKVEVHASERALLLVNLPQAARAVQLNPAGVSSSDQQFDWALRQAAAWRPVLRLDDAPAPNPAGADTPAPALGDAGVSSTEDAGLARTSGSVSMSGGGDASALAAPMLATAFRLDTVLWGDARVAFSGDLGTDGAGAGADSEVQAVFRPSTAPDSQSRLMVAMRQVDIAGLSNVPSLRVVTLNYADGVDVSDHLHLQFGSMFNTVTMTDSMHTFNPYLRAIYRLGGGQVEYRAASAVPPIHFGDDDAEMADPTPQITLEGNRARLEAAHHQELQYDDSLSPNTSVTVAVFEEGFERAAIDGAMADSDEIRRADLLPDLLNNMFLANGGNYGGWGYRAGVERRLGETWRAALAYTTGPGLVALRAQTGAELATALGNAQIHAYTLKLSGDTPLTHTHLICGYRGLSRTSVTGTDLYDDGMGQSGAYANVYLRQPLPGRFNAGGKLQATVEIHNLLAQGYVPMLGVDGQTLYLMQTARALRGGLALSF